MHPLLIALLAVGTPAQPTSTQIGTAQVLTFGIPLGGFGFLVLLSLFVFRSGHERAHRAQVMRRQRRAELEHERPSQLEAIHAHPSIEEELPQ